MLGDPTPPGVLYHAGTTTVMLLRGNNTANYRHCIKWKEATAALAKQTPERARMRAAIGHSGPETQRARHSAEQMYLDEG